MPLADDVSYYMETAKKRFHKWWMYLPYQNKLAIRLGTGGAGILSAIYIYFTYMGTTPALGASAALGILSAYIFFSGVKEAMS